MVDSILAITTGTLNFALHLRLSTVCLSFADLTTIFNGNVKTQAAAVVCPLDARDVSEQVYTHHCPTWTHHNITGSSYSVANTRSRPQSKLEGTVLQAGHWREISSLTSIRWGTWTLRHHCPQVLSRSYATCPHSTPRVKPRSSIRSW